MIMIVVVSLMLMTVLADVGLRSTFLYSSLGLKVLDGLPNARDISLQVGKTSSGCDSNDIRCGRLCNLKVAERQMSASRPLQTAFQNGKRGYGIRSMLLGRWSQVCPKGWGASHLLLARQATCLTKLTRLSRRRRPDASDFPASA